MEGITVLVMRNVKFHCMGCGTPLNGEPLAVSPEVTHWTGWCPEGACKYAMRRLRVPLDLVKCEVADG